MNPNPFAPPAAVVADVSPDGQISPQRSTLTTIAAWVPALLGALLLLLVIVGVLVVSRRVPNAVVIALGLYGAMSIGAAIGIHRHIRSVAVLWCVLCAALMLMPFTRTRELQAVHIIMIIYLALQLLVAVLGVWTAIRWRRKLHEDPNPVTNGI